MDKIKMGVIGLGGIAESVHIKGILKSPDAELAAVCDVNRELLKRIGDQYGIPEHRRFSSPAGLLESGETDAVSICTANSSHAEIARACARCQKAMAVEKPLALSGEEAAGIASALRGHPVPNMMCFSYRFKAAARYARHIIQSGLLGKIRHIYVQYFQSWAMDETLPLYWRFNKALCGSGALGDLGSHMIDLTRFLVGDFERVSAHAGTFVKNRKLPAAEGTGKVDVDDFCHFHAEISGGIAGAYNITRFAYGRSNYQRVEIYGSQGALLYSLEDDDTLEACIGEVYHETKSFVRLPVPERFKADQMQSFFDLVRGRGDGLAATIEDGVRCQKVLDGIEKSMETGQWVSV
jgi:predicted dehydrogenase